MGAIAEKVVGMDGKPFEPEVIEGAAKLTKNGNIKRTPNNQADEHFVFPIKEDRHVEEIKEYLWRRIEDPNSRLRDLRGYGRNYLMFCIGINVGLRYSDLVNLTWDKIFRTDMRTFRSIDTGNKKEQKTGKLKVIFVNDAIKKAVTKYIERFDIKPAPNVSIFALDERRITENTKAIIDAKTGKVKKIIIESYTVTYTNGKSKTIDKDSYKPPVSDTMVGIFIKDAGEYVGIDYPICTHTLRKTYAYHLYMKNKDNPRILSHIQQMLGHINQADTIRYLGLEREMQQQMIMELNL